MKNTSTKNTPNKDSITTIVKLIRLLTIGFINLIAVILAAIVVLLAWLRFTQRAIITQAGINLTEGNPITNPIAGTDNQSSLSNLPSFQTSMTTHHSGISRRTLAITTIPSRTRTDIITYTVNSGDTLFSIADQYKIQPATLLWGNFDVLEDNPHLLKPGQVLNVLPIDGTYYQWKEGDSLESVASFFKTKPEAITEFTGNDIDLTEINQKNAGIEPGKWIIVPGGKRAIKDWGPPAISRSNPATARTYGPGYCGAVTEGAIGTQNFLWPAVNHSISGYNYDPSVHPAIDIAGNVGDAVYASDSGVVVYAGWSNFGYGYLIVIDHGFGWQTAYAHLSAVGVNCGQSVFRGGIIGAIGSTGNSTGAHLHFELSFNGAKLNPLDFVQ